MNGDRTTFAHTGISHIRTLTVIGCRSLPDHLCATLSRLRLEEKVDWLVKRQVVSADEEILVKVNVDQFVKWQQIGKRKETGRSCAAPRNRIEWDSLTVHLKKTRSISTMHPRLRKREGHRGGGKTLHIHIFRKRCDELRRVYSINQLTNKHTHWQSMEGSMIHEGFLLLYFESVNENLPQSRFTASSQDSPELQIRYIKPESHW